MDITFQPMFDQMGQEILTLAEKEGAQYKAQAIADATTIVNNMKDDLQRWGSLLAKGQLNADELQLLVNNEKTLLVMTGLEEAGVAQIHIEEFLTNLLAIIVSAVKNFIGSLGL